MTTRIALVGNIVRVWGSVKREDGSIVCEVRDFASNTDDFKSALLDPSFRHSALSVVEPGVALVGHSRGRVCAPGKPCARCQKGAAAWWHEVDRRAADWQFCGVSAQEVDRRDGWCAAQWTARTKSLSEAVAAARANGFGVVVERNGLGDERRRMNVATGAWTPDAPPAEPAPGAEADNGPLFARRSP